MKLFTSETKKQIPSETKSVITSETNKKRQKIGIEPGTFYQLQDIIKTNIGHLSLKELENCYHPDEGIKSGLRDILKKHINTNNWLKSVEGKNIEIHFYSDGYDPPKSYFYHVDGGEIKRNTFGGCANETPWRRKYINADGSVSKKSFTWGSPVDDVSVEENQKSVAVKP